MQADFQRLKRRPFLVPLLMPLALLAIVVGAAIWLLDARISTAMILVRHAELEQRESATPRLSVDGQARANSLLTLLARAKPNRGIDVVYVAEDSPSQQTAAPLAQTMGLAVNIVPATEWKDLPRFIERNHTGEVALVVGNRAALLSILKPLQTQPQSPELTLAEDDYSSVFVVVSSRLSKPSVIRLRY